MPSPDPVETPIDRLRHETRSLHERLDERIDIVERLADFHARHALIARFAALHLPAPEVLGSLRAIADLDLDGRSRVRHFAGVVPPAGMPPFPAPSSQAEALGMLYVLEGSTLGGRLILRRLADRGVSHQDFAFLDPYGDATGARWRDFVRILNRETGRDRPSTDDAARGAVKAFLHAEAVLCD